MPASIDDRLSAATDRALRHNFDIGDYWNLCEEAKEEISRLKKALQSIADWHLQKEKRLLNPDPMMAATHRICSKRAIRAINN